MLTVEHEARMFKAIWIAVTVGFLLGILVHTATATGCARTHDECATATKRG